MLHGQVFANPLNDRVAKHFLKASEKARISCLSALSGHKIYTARVLDENYNPLDKYQRLKQAIHGKKTQELMKSLQEGSDFIAYLDKKESAEAAIFLRELAFNYGDLKRAMPDPRDKTSVDFLCETDVGWMTIEFQIKGETYWDQRALAYAAAIYGNQLHRGDDWSDIKRVLAINVFDKTDEPRLWGRKPVSETQTPYMRHYAMKDQHGHTMPYLELIQYALDRIDFKNRSMDHSLRDWLDFFEGAMERKELPKHIKDEGLIEAYDMVRVDHLKKDPALYDEIHKWHGNVEEHNERMKAEGKRRGKLEMARSLKKAGMSIEFIMEHTKLTSKEIELL
jgi:predicted transposase/invertase (TIGR01784 family)